MRLIECVPNFSTGRDPAVIAAIRDAIAAVDGVSVLHVTSDASHNRSVITFVAPYDTMAEAAFTAIRVAREQIDLTQHAGVHPRIGAADVVPFVPLDGATMEDCIALAHTVGERVGRELEIPVYLYERAATRPSRRNLADVRHGGFEGLREAIRVDAERVPDYGPSHVHPTFGAVAIGARPMLVAFNVYIGDASQLPAAKEIARVIRTSSGGLPAVKALGLEVDGQAQVSMNLVDIETTPLSVAYEAVRTEAAARGALITWSEIIGLVPATVVADAAGKYLRLRQPVEAHVLERHLLDARETPHALHTYLEAVGGDTATPGGGSVAAYTGALASALTRMVARLTMRQTKFATVHEVMTQAAVDGERLANALAHLASRDTQAYEKVVHAYAAPRVTEAEIQTRQGQIHEALLHAAEVPLQTAALCCEVMVLAEQIAQQGNPHAITDVGTAALLAEAACRAAAYNVRVNLRTLRDIPAADELAKNAKECVAQVRVIAERVAELVEKTLGK